MLKFVIWATRVAFGFVAAVTVSNIHSLSAALVIRFISANCRLVTVAFLLLGLAASSILAGSAQAEEDCLAAPSGRPPPGGKWLYRTDNVTQRKCWHLRTQGDAAPPGAAAAQPAAARSTPNPDQAGNQYLEPGSATSPALSGSSVKQDIQQDKLVADAAAWPDPPAPANTAFKQLGKLNSFQDRQDSAVQRFIGRLSALSQTHTLLAESRWQGARLDQLPKFRFPVSRLTDDLPGSAS